MEVLLFALGFIMGIFTLHVVFLVEKNAKNKENIEKASKPKAHYIGRKENK